MQAIFIEAGHGRSLMGIKKDVGAVGRFGSNVYYERSICQELARRVINILNAKSELKSCLVQGVGVETDAHIRAKMKFVNQVIRENKFSREKCLGVAIHLNASVSNKPRGFEVWYQKNEKSKPLAESLARSWQAYQITPLRFNTIKNNKTSRYGRFYTDDALCEYVIIETSFISNLEDVKAITSNFDRTAECIAHGILEHIRAYG